MFISYIILYILIFSYIFNALWLLQVIDQRSAKLPSWWGHVIRVKRAWNVFTVWFRLIKYVPHFCSAELKRASWRVCWRGRLCLYRLPSAALTLVAVVSVGGTATKKNCTVNVGMKTSPLAHQSLRRLSPFILPNHCGLHENGQVLHQHASQGNHRVHTTECTALWLIVSFHLLCSIVLWFSSTATKQKPQLH